jgi:glucose-6-phosphate isomerase/transaldolase/glucose-6-phosphate isomerase
MAERCFMPDVRANPATALGALMAAGARAGRDKLTLVLPPDLEAFGLWVEQLVAESTGKQGHGVIPIAGETLGEPTVYGSDRFFVRLRVAGDPTEEQRDRAMAGLTGAPIVTIDFPEPAALGAEFVRWEVATAICGALLGINPFDEPNVQQAKDATNALLARYKADGRLPAATPDIALDGGIELTASRAAKSALGNRRADDVLALVLPGDYVGLLAYLGPDATNADILHRFRMSVRDRTHAATMFGYGPRYLHSTGQLHKGGPNSGVFVVVTAATAKDLPVPGQPFSFGTLELAQGLGDFASLDATGRRAVHVHLPRPDAALLGKALGALLGDAGPA